MKLHGRCAARIKDGRSGRRGAVLIAVAFACACFAATAWAAQGDITAQDCVSDDLSGDAGCAQDEDGMVLMRDVVVSPDGISVYTVAQTSDAIARFDRNTSTGALTPAGCIKDSASAHPCTTSTAGLDGAYGLAISPDGTSVYVAADTDDAIVRFDRNTSTGALTAVGCVRDDDTGEATCGQESPGLDTVRGVAVSADGSSLYAASQGDDAVVRLDRNTSNGTLTPQGCVEDDDAGADSCTQSTDGLNGAISVTVSPDGKSVYAAAFDDDAITHLTRDTGTGALAPQDCIDDTDIGVEDGCGANTAALFDVTSVAVSNDSKSVYTTSNSGDAVARFDRNTATGALTSQGCVDDEDTGPYTCGQTAKGLDGAADVAVARDGGTVYVASRDDDAVLRLDRTKATGALTPQDCVDENDGGQGADECGASTDGLDGAYGIAVSRDRISVYATSVSDHALVRFNRDAGDVTEPTTTIDSGPTGATSDTTPTYTFSSNETATFECRFDADPFAECSGSGTHTPGSALGEGAHTFEVRATDDSANTDQTPASAAITVDTSAPDTTINSGPAPGGLTKDSTPTFTFLASELGASFECRLDAGSFAPCSGPGATHTSAVLGDGAHTFEVRASDPAGNTDASPAARSFTLDATRPVLTLGSRSYSKGKLRVGFSANEPVVFRCSFQGGPLTPCSSPATFKAAKPGKYTLVITGTDTAGNPSSPLTYRFTVKPPKKKLKKPKKK